MSEQVQNWGQLKWPELPTWDIKKAPSLKTLRSCTCRVRSEVQMLLMNEHNQTQKKRKFNLSVGLLKMWYSFRWMVVRVSRDFMFESIKIFDIDLFVLIAWCCDICFPMTQRHCGKRVLVIQTAMKLFMLISTIDVPQSKTWHAYVGILLLSSSSFLSPLSRVFIIIYLKQTMFLGYIV